MKYFRFLTAGVCLTLAACGSEQNTINPQASNILIHKELTEHYPNVPITFQPEFLSLLNNVEIQPEFKWTLLQSPRDSQVLIDDSTKESLTFIPDVPGLYTFSVEIIQNNQTDTAQVHLPVLDKNIDFNCPISPVNSIEIRTVSSHNIQKENYIEADIRLEDSLQSSTTFLKTEIRGRGNSTWEHNKKPYRLKLFKKDSHEMFSMPNARNWALLANAFDGTNLRNASALCLGKNFITKSWTPDYRFTNLSLNNKYRGLYLMTEHVEVAKHKIDISGHNHTEFNQDDISFFIELTPDSRLNSKDTYVKTHFNHYYEVKSDLSESDIEKESELKKIRKFLNDFETSLFNANFSENDGYQNFLDLDSAAEYIILNELFKDHDRFWASTHLFKAKNEKLHFGPLWDYDVAAGNFSGFHQPTGWLVINKLIPQALLKDPNFKTILMSKWDELSQKLPHLIHYIDLEAQSISQSQVLNQQLWPLNKFSHSFGSKAHRYLGATHSEQVNELKSWLILRAVWINENISSL